MVFVVLHPCVGTTYREIMNSLRGARVPIRGLLHEGYDKTSQTTQFCFDCSRDTMPIEMQVVPYKATEIGSMEEWMSTIVEVMSCPFSMCPFPRCPKPDMLIHVTTTHMKDDLVKLSKECLPGGTGTAASGSSSTSTSKREREEITELEQQLLQPQQQQQQQQQQQ
eukprot:PhF_6_TR10225/c0_g1_i1/m.15847